MCVYIKKLDNTVNIPYYSTLLSKPESTLEFPLRGGTNLVILTLGNERFTNFSTSKARKKRVLCHYIEVSKE